MNRKIIGIFMVCVIMLAMVGCSNNNDTDIAGENNGTPELSLDFIGEINASEVTIVEEELYTNTEKIQVVNNSETVGFMVYLYDIDNLENPIMQHDIDDNVEFTGLTSATNYKIGLFYDEDISVDITITD
ncbi:MAG: hypothetical protein R3Y35_09170 [Clostridia bacterium]